MEKFCNAVVSVLGIQTEVLGVSQIGRWKGKWGAVKEKDNHVFELEPGSVSLPPTAAMAHLQQKLVPFSIAVFALGLGLEEAAGGDLSGAGGNAYLCITPHQQGGLVDQ